MSRYGSAEGVPLNARRYRYDLAAARRMVNRYADRTATSAAVRLIQSELLGYRAPRGYSYQRDAEAYLGRLVASAADPFAILARIVAWHLVTERRPFRTEREEAVSLGRWVLSTVPFRRKRPGAEKLPSVNACREVGEITREALGVYALGLIRKDRSDTDVRTSLRRDSADFESPSIPST
jgi:hypothetical protein